MPVARIYTRFPAESAVIAARLRNHGYTIEIVDPGDFRVTPADLEIQLDRLRTGEALAQATRFARERDAEIFVGTGLAFDDEAHRALEGAGAAPGLLGGVTRLIRRVRRIGAESHAVRAARRQQKLNLELAREAERKQRAEEKAAQREERERREREAEARRAAEREAQLARQREVEQQRAAEREALLARQQQEEAQRAAERQRQEAEQRQQEEVQRREHAAAAARLASEQEERRRVEAEAARAEHDRQAELMARVAEQRRLAEQERVAEAAAVAQAKSPEPEAKSPEPEAKRPEVEAKRPAAEVRPAVAPIAKPRMVPPAVVAREGENSRATKRAFVAAAVIAILAAIGWGAYENRMPASPLSNADRVRSGAIQQEVPFGAATIKPAAQPPANTVRPPAQQARVTPQKAQSKPSPQASKPAATRPRHKQRFADDSDMIATDEVVYHGAPRKPANATGKPTSTQNAQNVKKISDIGDQ